MSDASRVALRQQADYQFTVDFGGNIPPLLADEPPPLGQGAGPAPTQFLVAACVNCLADSLLFALRKFGQKPEPIEATGEATVERNEQKRLRVKRIDVTIKLGGPAASIQHLDRALGSFEDFCTVTGSVRQGIEVVVAVYDSTGAKLK